MKKCQNHFCHKTSEAARPERHLSYLLYRCEQPYERIVLQMLSTYIIWFLISICSTHVSLLKCGEVVGHKARQIRMHFDNRSDAHIMLIVQHWRKPYYARTAIYKQHPAMSMECRVNCHGTSCLIERDGLKRVENCNSKFEENLSTHWTVSCAANGIWQGQGKDFKLKQSFKVATCTYTLCLTLHHSSRLWMMKTNHP